MSDLKKKITILTNDNHKIYVYINENLDLPKSISLKEVCETIVDETSDCFYIYDVISDHGKIYISYYNKSLDEVIHKKLPVISEANFSTYEVNEIEKQEDELEYHTLRIANNKKLESLSESQLQNFKLFTKIHLAGTLEEETRISQSRKNYLLSSKVLAGTKSEQTDQSLQNTKKITQKEHDDHDPYGIIEHIPEEKSKRFWSRFGSKIASATISGAGGGVLVGLGIISVAGTLTGGAGLFVSPVILAITIPAGALIGFFGSLIKNVKAYYRENAIPKMSKDQPKVNRKYTHSKLKARLKNKPKNQLQLTQTVNSDINHNKLKQPLEPEMTHSSIFIKSGSSLPISGTKIVDNFILELYQSVGGKSLNPVNGELEYILSIKPMNKNNESKITAAIRKLLEHEEYKTIKPSDFENYPYLTEYVKFAKEGHIDSYKI